MCRNVSVKVLIAATETYDLTENYDLLVADFTFDGVNYRVRSTNASLREFYEIVNALVDR